MNKYKLPVLGFSLMLLIASCKKNDVLQPNIPTNKTSRATNTFSEWKFLSNWTTLKGNKITSYTSNLSDSNLTSDVAKSGMVLAFVKNNNGIKALPFQESGSSSYWYYQISNNTITFSCDNYTSTPDLTINGFTYFIFTSQKLKDLESVGNSKSKLMQMSYNDISNLLK